MVTMIDCEALGAEGWFVDGLDDTLLYVSVLYIALRVGHSDASLIPKHSSIKNNNVPAFSSQRNHYFGVYFSTFKS